MAFPRPKTVVKTSVRDGAVLVYRGREIAEEAAKLAKAVPTPPAHLEATLARAAKVRMNLATGSALARIGRDSKTVMTRVLAGESVKHQPLFKRLVTNLVDADWIEILRKIRHSFNEQVTVRVVAAKGLLFELWLRRTKNFEDLLVRCAKKVKSVGKYKPELFVVRAARTLDDGREVADYLVVAFDRHDNPQSMWVLAIIESKSEYNALSVVRHEAPSAVQKFGSEATLMGQPVQSLKRLTTDGVDLRTAAISSIDGKTTVKNAGLIKGDFVRAVNESGRNFADQTTELIGVVPKDAPAGDLKRIVRDSPKQGIQVWFHETTGMETNFLAYELLRAFDE
jgi:hypothetical protein